MSVKQINPELQDKDPQMSKEELAKRREEITAFYKDNIPHLEVQADLDSADGKAFQDAMAKAMTNETT